MNKQENGHAVTRAVGVPALDAYRFLMDPYALGKWALGCMNITESDDEGVFTGISLFDGERSYLKIDADPKRKVVDYYIGQPGSLKPRISTRVVDGETVSLPSDNCLVTLSAWRDATMDDERWQRLCITHETEIYIIKSLLESR